VPEFPQLEVKLGSETGTSNPTKSTSHLDIAASKDQAAVPSGDCHVFLRKIKQWSEGQLQINHRSFFWASEALCSFEDCIVGKS
jgi:hypothetical protein